ncbi:hypothetical protein EYZ11_005165 [Aspergillus tanneri]|uniref:Uncharacterized protein n=1 Tax=Aspergillus tanneri TaxID=1220188 RepID=A0A4S3JPH7_9EURO|nr:hypothetical protein EYZ11_005165 [Aspergillus tanneri]
MAVIIGNVERKKNIIGIPQFVGDLI